VHEGMGSAWHTWPFIRSTGAHWRCVKSAGPLPRNCLAQRRHFANQL